MVGDTAKTPDAATGCGRVDLVWLVRVEDYRKRHASDILWTYKFPSVLKAGNRGRIGKDLVLRRSRTVAKRIDDSPRIHAFVCVRVSRQVRVWRTRPAEFGDLIEILQDRF